MNGDVERRVREAVRDHGPITFAEFMEVALYSAGGFYDVPPVGERGDFVTSPHVHGVFAELIASGLREMWEQLGEPSPFTIVEVGAGDGTLARRLVAHLADVPLRYAAVERSAGARRALAAVPGVEVAERLRDVGAVVGGVVLANELLDNLPFRRVRILDGRATEVRIALGADDRLSEVQTECDASLAAIVARATRDGADGGGELDAPAEIAVPVAALGFVDELAATLEVGWAVLIDYGARRPGGGVRGYRSHRVLDDLLSDPGSSDLTAEVDFAAIAARAAEDGLRVDGLPTQREALVALGLERWAREELERQGRLQRDRAGIEAVRAWSGRSRATLLVDPAGLGRLRWLVVSRGVAAPRWLSRVPEAASAARRRRSPA
jgi:SAM-dependent MidA family methyltransferase